MHKGTRRAQRGARRTSIVVAVATLVVGLLPGVAAAQLPDPTDPRTGLGAGYPEAEQASAGMQHLARRDKAPGFDGAVNDFGKINSDLALTGDHAIVGNYNGFQVYDVSDPADPAVRTAVVCPGGQGDPTVYGDLLFISVEQSSARTDCTTTSPPEMRFQGVRIFDISDLDNPEQVATVQTCRGSHTHTLVTDPDDPENVYIYNSGTAGVRNDRPECVNGPPTDPNTTLWRIDVIKVPVDAPEDAAIVNQPRIFRDESTGAVNGLQNGPTQPTHPSGAPYSPQPNTNTCHDMTAYPAIGLAAGACQGNGILLDITDPANPERLDAVADPNFAYWHSATFNNDGTKVVFTDEWGGGTGPRCRATDQLSWGANAIFDIVDGKMEFASYYKLRAPQTNTENCVAHNGSLVPVPGRDVMVQAWYQGGTSVWDFTDSANPTEIAYFDRGPVRAESLGLGGHWASYWHNGNIFGTEIARGFDSFALTATDMMTANEIDAASTVVAQETNPQHQQQIVWAPSFPLVRATSDQLERADGISDASAQRLEDALSRAERFADGPQARAALAQLDNAARMLDNEARNAERGPGRGDAEGLRDLAQTVRDLADTMR